MGELTRSAGRFAAELRYGDIPPGAAATAMTGIADCVSVILLGLDEPVTSIVAAGAPRGMRQAHYGESFGRPLTMPR